MSGPVFEFGDFQLDCGRFELSREGHTLRVERKPMELLILLASREGLLVTRAEIAQRLWSSDVFVDTEHGINTAIRKLRHSLRDDPEDPQFIQTVTGMGYRFIAPIVTVEPAALAQPEPAVDESDATVVHETIPLATEEAAQKSLVFQLAIAARFIALTAAFILMAIPHKVAGILHRDANPPIASLAVIPLDNLSGDLSQEYFADGMTDELITMLAKDSTLRITSRTSVMQYKGVHRPLPEIARALNVDAILEGSISRTGGQIHMNLQLIRADADTHLWAESYDRGINEAVSLPDEAARAIAQRLRRVTFASTPVKYVNPAAYDAYLQGKYLWFSEQRLLESKKYFERATEIQPDYAMAWAWLSAYYGAATVWGILDPRESLTPMGEAAERAMRLDPNLADSHLAMAAAYFFQQWNLEAADKELSQAISLDPQYAELYHLRAKLLIAMNRDQEALSSEKKAMEINPFERPWGLVHLYASARQYDAAIADGQLRVKADPTDPSLLFYMFDTYRRKGMFKESVEACAQYHRVLGDPKSAEELKRAFQAAGWPGFVHWEITRRMQEAKKSYVSPMELASYHAQLGERNATFALLEEGYKQRAPDLLWIQAEPAFDFLHSDPRYRSLVQRVGLPPTY